jgi:putative transposase
VKKRQEVEPEHPMIPISRQCELVELSRSSFYYRSCGEDGYNLALMRLIDEEFTRHPFYGARRMAAWLRSQGYGVNRKRVSRLMRLMGLMALYPKPRLSANGPDHKVYPYLLKGVTVKTPDEAWSSDITYIRLAHGFVYLVVIMDWHSRYVLSWELSTTLDKAFCLDALQRALLISKPGIFNTDQGPQYASEEFSGVLESEGIKISMDGRGRVYDNIFVERFWRTVKYEEVYLHEYRTVAEAREHLSAYFRFYNEERLHERLGYRTPHEVYFGTPAPSMPTAEAVV